MMTLTKKHQQEIQAAARHAARHHPWRASWLEVASIVKDFDSRDPHGKRLTVRGVAVKQLFNEAFEEESKKIPAFTGGPGGEPCDRCGKPVEEGRWNVCLSCAAHDEE